MLNNILDEMANIVKETSSAIASSIIYSHRLNGTIVAVTNTTATVEPLVNFKIENTVIKNGKSFILSKNVEKNSEFVFLNEKNQRNDTITIDGEIWYVIESFESSIDLVVICSQDKFTLTTNKVSFR